MPKPVLVTGGFGFLGSYVSRALAMLGRPVVIYDLARGTREAQKLLEPHGEHIRFIQGSISDLPRLEASIRQEQVDAVVHAAALCDAQALFREPYKAFETNTIGTLNVLEAAHRSRVSRVVHVSSVTALAEKQYQPLDERHAIFDPSAGHPSGPYGASKAAAEIIGVAYWDALDLDYVGVRFSGIYGYGMSMPMYIKPMVALSLQGKPCHLAGGGPIRRSLVYVKDAADAVTCALGCDVSRLRQRVFVVAGPLCEIRQVAERIRALIPGADIEIGDALSEYERRRLENSAEYSMTQTAAQLGFRLRYDLERGLKDYIATYREHEG